MSDPKKKKKAARSGEARRGDSPRRRPDRARPRADRAGGSDEAKDSARSTRSTSEAKQKRRRARRRSDSAPRAGATRTETRSTNDSSRSAKKASADSKARQRKRSGSNRRPNDTSAAAKGTPTAAESKPGKEAGARQAPAPPAPAPPAPAPRAARAEPATGELESAPGARGAPRYADEERELEQVEDQIRALEARLDGMIRESETLVDEPEPPSIREQVSFAAREVVDRFAAPVERPGSDDGGVVDAVRELLSSDYYLRQWGRLGMRNRSEEVDDFGLDPVYESRFIPLFDFLYDRYFRVECEGIEHVPPAGPTLVVANHSGTIPLDGLMLRTCFRREHPAGRELRWLAEDFVYYLPFIGAFMSRIGAVRACQENAERLLGRGELVAVFPEGVKGIGKLYRDRYRLQRFGRGGFIRLCLRTSTPLVPCAIVGAEETSPMLYRDERVSRALGLPYLPVTPTFPWLGPAGLIPAPTKWKMIFGEPLSFQTHGPEAAEDDVLVGRLAEQVRASIQQLIDRALEERRSIWFG